MQASHILSVLNRLTKWPCVQLYAILSSALSPAKLALSIFRKLIGLRREIPNEQLLQALNRLQRLTVIAQFASAVLFIVVGVAGDYCPQATCTQTIAAAIYLAIVAGCGRMIEEYYRTLI